MGGARKIPYPKHVWSPSGGWYSQPANWRANTAVALACIFGVSAIVFTISANLEERYHYPEPGRFYPSRYWSRGVIEHEKKMAEEAANKAKSESS
ncbi:hypothetical protein MKZ38_003232 [Zalerion maritima]|uniref:Uncharacterized protein n=1 Tax=Zalerion maritima TaxID=339359 RepID=A0AAD5RZ10_9PEZI|nr:hypothetical protein MKZ38_003232 [Zalerion maritima]